VRRAASVAGAAVLAALGFGCAREKAPNGTVPDTAGPMSGASSADGNGRSEVLGAFLAEYWSLPVPAQGEGPDGFSDAERSLDPAVCGSCHPTQYAQWRTSLHAEAYSPGLAGQLIEGGLSKPSSVRQCQLCHAPLTEQQPWNAAGEAEPRYDPALRERGIVCASCHVRAHRHYGPPRRADAAPVPGDLPHGGFEARSEFQESRFCAECHQFFDQEGVEGKPVQNTFVEWRASTHAEDGRTCQSCHMPDRAHTWRGIHDAEMVRGAVDVTLSDAVADDGRVTAVLVLTNHGVGHAFPTYVTPRVTLAAWQVDAEDREIADTRAELVIGRKIDFSASQERFDTRVLPGESEQLEYAMPRSEAARALIGRVTVDPGFHYRGVFRSLLGSLTNADARARISEALRGANASIYVLSEERSPLPRPPSG